MITEVAVEQLLIGWSRTSNGKNVLARSPGWPTDPSRSEWVTALGDFLHPAIDKVVRSTGEVPWLLEFRPSPHGSILMAKVYAADSLRAGEFQVHAVLDPSRTLGPQHLLGLVEAGMLMRERPADATQLESRTIQIPPVAPIQRVRPVALVLRFLHSGEPLLVQALTLDEAAILLDELAAVLPARVAEATPARSLLSDVTDVRGIAIAVPPWSREADTVELLDEVPVAPSYLQLAEQLLAGELALPDAEPETVQEWLDFALLDPKVLTIDDLTRGLAGTHAQQWVEAAFARTRTRDLLVDLMRRGEVRKGAWPQSGTVEEELAALLDEGAANQAAVARSVPDRLLRSLVVRLGDRLVVRSPALVDRLRGLGQSPQDFTLETGGTSWTDWTDEAWLQWLESDSELWPGLRRGIDHEGFEGRFGKLLDRLPHHVLDAAARQLTGWPADRLGVLADALVRSDNAPPDLFIQTLDRLPPEDVRRLVQRTWPGLGRQLGLPAAVVQALKPNRGWFG